MHRLAVSIICFVFLGATTAWYFIVPFNFDMSYLDDHPTGTFECQQTISDSGRRADVHVYVSHGLVRVDLADILVPSNTSRPDMHWVVQDDALFIWTDPFDRGFIIDVKGAFGVHGTGSVIRCHRRLLVDDSLFALPNTHFDRWTISSDNDGAGNFLRARLESGGEYVRLR